MSLTTVIMTTLLAITGPGDTYSASGTLTLQNCQVQLIKDIDVPAAEAGLLLELNVREESPVSEDQIIAKIDEREAMILKKAAESALAAAKTEANNNVRVEFARMTNETDKAEYDKNKLANRNSRSGDVITLIELMRLELKYKTSGLQIKQAELDKELAKFTELSKQAELEAAELKIDRRKVQSHINGMVVKLYKQEGEWVAIGEPIVQIVQMDKLKVAGRFPVEHYSPAQLRNRRVTVTANIGGVAQSFDGRVASIGHLVELGHCDVFVEVENRQENNEWLLRPGMMTNMQIHLNEIATDLEESPASSLPVQEPADDAPFTADSDLFR